MKMHDLTFTTTEQYVAWRDLWRAKYKDIVIAIRTLKNGIAVAKRDDQPWFAQQLNKLREEAVLMLSTRRRSKAIASLIYDKHPLEEALIKEYIRAAIARQQARAIKNMAKALEARHSRGHEKQLKNPPTKPDGTLAIPAIPEAAD